MFFDTECTYIVCEGVWNEFIYDTNVTLSIKSNAFHRALFTGSFIVTYFSFLYLYTFFFCCIIFTRFIISVYIAVNFFSISLYFFPFFCIDWEESIESCMQHLPFLVLMLSLIGMMDDFFWQVFWNNYCQFFLFISILSFPDFNCFNRQLKNILFLSWKKKLKKWQIFCKDKLWNCNGPPS